jgi:hypothetical protein
MFANTNHSFRRPIQGSSRLYDLIYRAQPTSSETDDMAEGQRWADDGGAIFD